MPGTREKDIFCVGTHLETKSFKIVSAKFCRKFNFNNYPRKSQIYRWVHKFQTTGSVNNLNKKADSSRYGRKLTARCPDNVDAVWDSVRRSSKKSLQKCSQELGLSRASLQRSLEKKGESLRTSLATRLYRPLLPVGLQGYILYRHRAFVFRFLLFVLPLLVQ